MTLNWTPHPKDGALIEAVTEHCIYHICTAVGRTTWWSEYCESPREATDPEDARAQAQAAHDAFEASCWVHKDTPHLGMSMRIWVFSDAPQRLQDLSTNGGDEDWLVYIPAAFLAKHDVPFFCEASPFAVCSLIEIPVIDGSKFLIATHA